MGYIIILILLLGCAPKPEPTETILIPEEAIEEVVEEEINPDPPIVMDEIKPQSDYRPPKDWWLEDKPKSIKRGVACYTGLLNVLGRSLADKCDSTHLPKELTDVEKDLLIILMTGVKAYGACSPRFLPQSISEDGIRTLQNGVIYVCESIFRRTGLDPNEIVEIQ